MGKRPRLDAISAVLTSGKCLTLTDAQYEAKTGIALPKDTYYLKNGSALARLCKEYGYCIEVQEKRVFLRKECQTK